MGFLTNFDLSISDPEQQLKVFDPDSIYLLAKKIGKNNPKAAEIEADNAARQEWNRTADMALISGIEEIKILEIKKISMREYIITKLLDRFSHNTFSPLCNSQVRRSVYVYCLDGTHQCCLSLFHQV